MRATTREIAPDVHWLALGRGLRTSNVYLVRCDASWSLIDAGWSSDAAAIRDAAASLFGPQTPPTSILLTHAHPDHAGAVHDLAQLWDAPVLVHPDELPLALGDSAAIQRHAGPLDRWVILPMLRLAGRRRMEAMLARSSLKGVVRSFDPSAPLPGLSGWEALATPGHTPGHITLVRKADHVAITGDALVTIDLNSVRGVVLGEPKVAAPPWYTTWDWRAAKSSALAVARLAPSVLAAGHGVPLSGDDCVRLTREFVARTRD